MYPSSGLTVELAQGSGPHRSLPAGLQSLSCTPAGQPSKFPALHWGLVSCIPYVQFLYLGFWVVIESFNLPIRLQTRGQDLQCLPSTVLLTVGALLSTK